MVLLVNRLSLRLKISNIKKQVIYFSLLYQLVIELEKDKRLFFSFIRAQARIRGLLIRQRIKQVRGVSPTPRPAIEEQRGEYVQVETTRIVLYIITLNRQMRN